MPESGSNLLQSCVSATLNGRHIHQCFQNGWRRQDGEQGCEILGDLSTNTKSGFADKHLLRCQRRAAIFAEGKKNFEQVRWWRGCGQLYTRLSFRARDTSAAFSRRSRHFSVFCSNLEIGFRVIDPVDLYRADLADHHRRSFQFDFVERVMMLRSIITLSGDICSDSRCIRFLSTLVLFGGCTSRMKYVTAKDTTSAVTEIPVSIVKHFFFNGGQAAYSIDAWILYYLQSRLYCSYTWWQGDRRCLLSSRGFQRIA